MIRINKVRFQQAEKFFNRFYVCTPAISYIVRRPIAERPLKSIDLIMNCKTEEDLIKLGGAVAPKDGKITLEEYFKSRGIN